MGVEAEAIEAVYRARCRGFCAALATVTGSHESARDAVQEAFATALARRDDFRGGSLEAWIWRIAFNSALGGKRSARRLSLNGSAPELDPQLPDPERDPELAEALRQLPARRRLFVFLRYFADLSYAEIAEACGVSEGTVGAALAQSRSELAQALDPERRRR
jgi:RNA polymerase sigma-70 factor, ECF subfamily